MNGAKLTSPLYIYTIHSNNLESVHIHESDFLSLTNDSK